jgi:rRNA maturation endonuclease Nob1
MNNKMFEFNKPIHEIIEKVRNSIIYTMKQKELKVSCPSCGAARPNDPSKVCPHCGSK